MFHITGGCSPSLTVLIPEAGWSEWTRILCTSLFLDPDAPLSDEGDLLLGRELRGNYLSIMRTLSGYGPCTRAELIDILGGSRSSIGHYLKSLVGDLALVERETPIMEATVQGAHDTLWPTRFFARGWLASVQRSVTFGTGFGQGQLLACLIDFGR